MRLEFRCTCRKIAERLAVSERTAGTFVAQLKRYTDRLERLLRRAALEQVVSMSRAAELANEKLDDFREKLQAL